MPIKSCQLNGNQGFKYGDSGTCYTYNPTSASSKAHAKQKAINQALASGAKANEFSKYSFSGNINKDLPVKELMADDDNFVTAISLVDFPAIEENFLKFKEDVENITLSKVFEDKQIIVGPAMIPNKLIYRYNKQTNEEYNVFFSNETVEFVAHKYLQSLMNSNTTVQHEVPINCATVIESWLVSEENQNTYGYTVPNGTWMVAMKITDQGFWDNYVKSGKVNGFSIEGYFVSMAKELEMSQDIQPEYNEDEIAEETLAILRDLLKDL